MTGKATTKLDELRALYEPYLEGLSEYLHDAPATTRPRSGRTRRLADHRR